MINNIVPSGDLPDYPVEIAADYASVSALLVVGDRLGIVTHLEAGRPVSTQALAAASGLQPDIVTNYLEALAAAGVAGPMAGQPGRFTITPDFVQLRYEAGYVSWLMNANRPFIEFAREFVEKPAQARRAHLRDGREVAVSSAWGGSLGFYSLALDTILAEKPERAVDLGAGAAKLLIGILRSLPEATALALDIDSEACREARLAADAAMVGDRLTVVQRSIQSLADDPSPLAGASVVHAGFVLHDLMPDEDEVADAIFRQCLEQLGDGGILAITEAVPYASSERERRFSAAMTYLHHQFMGRKFCTEAEWVARLTGIGFARVEVRQHRLPGARLYIARKS